FGFCLIVWIGAALASWKGRPRLRGWLGRLTPEGRMALLLAIFIVIDTLIAIRARQNVGSARNQSLGVAWAVALLAAVGYAIARQRTTGSLVAIAAVGAVLLSVPVLGVGK